MSFGAGPWRLGRAGRPPRRRRGQNVERRAARRKGKPLPKRCATRVDVRYPGAALARSIRDSAITSRRSACVCPDGGNESDREARHPWDCLVAARFRSKRGGGKKQTRPAGVAARTAFGAGSSGTMRAPDGQRLCSCGGSLPGLPRTASPRPRGGLSGVDPDLGLVAYTPGHAAHAPRAMRGTGNGLAAQIA